MNGLDADAKRVLKRWARHDWYVYMRILSGVYFESTEADVMWVVNVECRTVPPQSYRRHGADLSTVIKELDLLVPRRSNGYQAERPGYSGWLAPEKPERPRRKRKKQKTSL